MTMTQLRSLVFLSFVGLLLAACGGGGSSSGSPAPTTPGQTSQPPTTISLGLFPTTLAGTKDADLDSDFIVTNLDKVGVALPMAWTLSGLPAGTTYSTSSNGSHMRIFGRPTVSGSFTVHVTIRDAQQATRVDANITLTLDTAFKLSTNGYVPPAVVGLPYSFHLDVANGVAPLTYALTTISGQPAGIPPGITFNSSTGTFSGTATATNPYTNANIKITDSSNPPRVIQGLLLGLEAVPPLQFSDQSFTFTTNQVSLAAPVFSGGVRLIIPSLVSGSLPPGMGLPPYENGNTIPFTGSPTAIGDWNAVIRLTDGYSPPEVVNANIHVRVNAPGPRVQTFLPHGVVGVPYNFHLSANVGTRPLTWSVTGLPPGLTAGSDGLIMGTPTAAGNYVPTITVTDSSIPTASDTKNPALVVKTFTGRNDSVATATAVTNGNYDASLSPYANASNVAQPDQDFYKVVVAPASTLSVTVAPRNTLFTSSITDPVLEFVDAGGLRLSNCKLPGGTTFSSPCMNDDIDPGVDHSSKLDFQNNTAADMTIYLHVLDWGGRARPDLLYQMSISGAK